jgi:hypothetical protein
MKLRNVFSLFIIVSFSVSPRCTRAQDRDTMSQNKIEQMDSARSATLKADQLQKTNDEARLDAAKLDRKETKAKSKEASRVEQEASTAARESRAAVRTEKRAQKSRREATKQSKRASDARAKSDKN